MYLGDVKGGRLDLEQATMYVWDGKPKLTNISMHFGDNNIVKPKDVSKGKKLYEASAFTVYHIKLVTGQRLEDVFETPDILIGLKKLGLEPPQHEIIFGKKAGQKGLRNRVLEYVAKSVNNAGHEFLFVEDLGIKNMILYCSQDIRDKLMKPDSV